MTKTELVHAWFDNLWNRGIESTIDEILAPDFVAHGLGEGDLVGRDQFHGFYRAFRSSFPSVRVTLPLVVESDDYATCQAIVEVLAASGPGPFQFHGSCTVRISDGQFVEGWNNFDFLSLLTNMGVVRPDAMTQALAFAAAPAP
jgi:hypothetical protein